MNLFIIGFVIGVRLDEKIIVQSACNYFSFYDDYSIASLEICQEDSWSLLGKLKWFPKFTTPISWDI